MKRMTLEQFKQFLTDHCDMKGITMEEVHIYFTMYNLGRQSVRW